jgi:pyruvate dehydrogenase E2 component (dihydrolipoamide acetyltransferase)
MRIEVELPEIEAEEATICSWYVDEDDEVEESEDLVELLAGEVTFSIPAPAAGKLVEIVAKEGDVVKVGDVLAILETEEEEEEEE